MLSEYLTHIVRKISIIHSVIITIQSACITEYNWPHHFVDTKSVTSHGKLTLNNRKKNQYAICK